MSKFCTVQDVYNFVFLTTGNTVNVPYLNASSLEDELDLKAFLFTSRLLQDLYDVRLSDIADFIDKKFKEKYTVTSADILGIISKALEEKPMVEPVVEIKKPKRGRPKKKAISDDMYKLVQDALESGMSKSAVQRKYNLTQTELTKYEGYKYWSDDQKADHNYILEYRRLHPLCSVREAIEKGCGKKAVSYRYMLVPTAEEQEHYNKSFEIKEPSPKAVIKNGYVKSLILSDVEQEEQQKLYEIIKEIAEIRKASPREITMQFKTRLTKDYGIVIDQIKKDLMMKYNIGRGEGKAPNALEAIVMSEYLPVAKSVLETMLEECKKVVL